MSRQKKIVSEKPLLVVEPLLKDVECIQFCLAGFAEKKINIFI